MGVLDVEYVVSEINRYLEGHNFKPRDADPTDHQYGDDRSLRFKTGTSRGEVAVTILEDGKPNQIIRILNPDHMINAKYTIDKRIRDHISAPKSSVLPPDFTFDR